MLIEFKVSNFKSIREEQTFSLVASNSDKELPGSVINRNLPGLSGVKFLKGAAIYGANASGKTNILEAIYFVADFIKGSATVLRPGDPTGAEPFKLDRDSGTKPSVFEISFLAEGVRYTFGLSVTPERVVEEFLIAYPLGAAQRWYRRTYDKDTGEYDWARPSASFEHDKDLEKKTRENSLLLSVGPQFNHQQLTKVFNWFTGNLQFIRMSAYSSSLRTKFTTALMEEQSHHDRIISLLRSADLGIVGSEISEHEISVEEQKENLPPPILAKMEKVGMQPIKHKEIRLIHEAEDMDPVTLDFDREESAGTQSFFALIGPWADILDKGQTVFVDEIGTSLHSHLVKELLELIFSEEHNPNGAQVIFTTHNPILLDGDLLRRDQIWFTEKTPAGTTHLYPLTDYKPRKDEALAKGYLAGRYGAIPYLPDGLKL